MSKKQKDSRTLTAVLPDDVEQVHSGYKKFQKWLRHHFSSIRRSVAYLLLTILSISSIGLIFLFVELLDRYEQIQEQERVVKEEFVYWEDILQSQQNSPDLYFQVAVSAYQMDDMSKAQQYIDRALFLDPQFTKARDLKMKIDQE